MSDQQACSIRDNFLIKLNNCRNEINSKFKQISENLVIRQNQLLAELDGIENKYSESQNTDNVLKQTEKYRNEQNKGLQVSFLPENIISSIKHTIESLDVEIYNLRQKLVTFTNIDIELDTASITTLIDKLGSVILTEDTVQVSENKESTSRENLLGDPTNNHVHPAPSENISQGLIKTQPPAAISDGNEYIKPKPDAIKDEDMFKKYKELEYAHQELIKTHLHLIEQSKESVTAMENMKLTILKSSNERKELLSTIDELQEKKYQLTERNKILTQQFDKLTAEKEEISANYTEIINGFQIGQQNVDMKLRSMEQELNKHKDLNTPLNKRIYQASEATHKISDLERQHEETSVASLEAAKIKGTHPDKQMLEDKSTQVEKNLRAEIKQLNANVYFITEENNALRKQLADSKTNLDQLLNTKSNINTCNSDNKNKSNNNNHNKTHKPELGMQLTERGATRQAADAKYTPVIQDRYIGAHFYLLFETKRITVHKLSHLVNPKSHVDQYVFCKSDSYHKFVRGTLKCVFEDKSAYGTTLMAGILLEGEQGNSDGTFKFHKFFEAKDDYATFLKIEAVMFKYFK